MFENDNSRAESAPPIIAIRGTAIASDGVAVSGTAMVKAAFNKMATRYIIIRTVRSFLPELFITSTRISSEFLLSSPVMCSPNIVFGIKYGILLA